MQPAEWPEDLKIIHERLIRQKALFLKRGKAMNAGTYGYMVPEPLLISEEIGNRVDVWSVECILLLLLFERNSFFWPVKLVTKKREVVMIFGSARFSSSLPWCMWDGAGAGH